MPSFRVDYVKDINELTRYVEKRFQATPEAIQGVRVHNEENSLVIAINSRLRRNGKRYEDVVSRISDMLAEFILNSYEKEIIGKIVNRICEGLPKNDIEEICRIACTRLYSGDRQEILVESRRRLISAKIAEYLRTSRNLALEGFVTFRLGEYVKRLETEIERSIRQYFVERQYEEYISLLSAFVRMQCPRVPELHVFVEVDGSYRVEGNGPFDIPDDVTHGYGIEKNQPIIQDDDFMIGFLLTCAPVRIFIHNADKFRNKELLNTIKTVFSECILLND